MCAFMISHSPNAHDGNAMHGFGYFCFRSPMLRVWARKDAYDRENLQIICMG